MNGLGGSAGLEVRPIDPVSALGQGGHDLGAFRVGITPPGGDLRKGAKTTQAQSARAVHDADFHTGRGDLRFGFAHVTVSNTRLQDGHLVTPK